MQWGYFMPPAVTVAVGIDLIRRNESALAADRSMHRNPVSADPWCPGNGLEPGANKSGGDDTGQVERQTTIKR